jgi:catechol 2,3-dioxygenase-like lactoylglutathione lyase family enzyme
VKKLNYAIVFVSDMAKAVKFYRDTLGLPLKFESPYWSEFANDGSTIALHPASVENPAGTCQLGFSLEGGLDALHEKLAAQGVKVVMTPRDEQFGIRQAVYADPDGLRFTLAQSTKK